MLRESAASVEYVRLTDRVRQGTLVANFMHPADRGIRPDGNQTTAEEGGPRDGLGVVQTRSIRRTSIVTT